jgi:GGDEF domain-containing protein
MSGAKIPEAKASGKKTTKPAKLEREVKPAQPVKLEREVKPVKPVKPAKSVKSEREAKPKRASKPLETEVDRLKLTCIDERSGLYHGQHFQLSLTNEFRRMERAEKPLGLIVVRISQAKDEDFHQLSTYLKSVLRPIDLAARLTGGEVAILIPEADRDRAVKLLKTLGREYEASGKLAGPEVVFGASLARPFQGGGPDELVQRAREHFGSAAEAAQNVLSGSNPWFEVDTAVAGPERDSLYSGFGSLSRDVSAGRGTR